jgi:hypothetical protein
MLHLCVPFLDLPSCSQVPWLLATGISAGWPQHVQNSQCGGSLSFPHSTASAFWPLGIPELFTFRSKFDLISRFDLI